MNAPLNALAPERVEITAVILNRGRPKLLPRVLEAFRRLRYRQFEVIVVGDRPHVTDYDLPPQLMHSFGYLYCAEANVSQARNMALAASRGEVVAFCDDDAVPEPNWLCHIARAFRDPSVGAAGGFVRGLDGVQFQWAGGCISSTGEEADLPLESQDIKIYEADSGIRASVLGANSAYRRTALIELGGFDESFRYYLDETDAVMRLIDAGWSVAHVPRAEVHHAYAENAHRTRARKPRDFFEIAASFAHFCREHGPQSAFEAAVARFRARKLGDLDRFIRLGVMTGSERRILEKRFDAGIAEGLARRPITPVRRRAQPAGPLISFTSRYGGEQPRIAVAHGWSRPQRAQRIAHHFASCGYETTLFQFGPGREPLLVRFDNGLWTHSGGTWRFGWRGFLNGPNHRAEMIHGEIARMMPVRGFQVLIRPPGRGFAHGPLEPEIIAERDGVGAKRIAVEPLSERHRILARRVAEELRDLLTNAASDVISDRPQGRRKAPTAKVVQIGTLARSTGNHHTSSG